MTRATVGALAGAFLAGMFGWELFKIARTGKVQVRKFGPTPSGWRLRYWYMSREENPRMFWVNVGTMVFFVAMGTVLAGWALISPSTFH